MIWLQPHTPPLMCSYIFTVGKTYNSTRREKILRKMEEVAIVAVLADGRRETHTQEQVKATRGPLPLRHRLYLMYQI